MPNWCENEIVLNFKNANKKMKQRLAILLSALEESGGGDGEIMGTLLPMPEELRGGESISGKGTPEQLAEQDRLRAEHGAADWYEWANKYWGTKWDLSDVTYDYDEKSCTLAIYCNSAWCPPIAFYQALVENGVEVRACFVEESCDFAGEFLNGDITDFSDVIANRDQFDGHPALHRMLESHWERHDEYEAEREAGDEDEDAAGDEDED